MSDASRSVFRIIEEATLGATPATPAFETQRVTSIGLKFSPTFKESAELLADLNVADEILVSESGGGDVGQEVSYGAVDTTMRGNMRADWLYTPVRDNALGAASQISAVTSTQYTLTTSAAPLATGITRNTGTPVAGMLGLATGFGVAGNNGLKLATAASATTFVAAGLATEATPPVTARLKVVGFQGASGDITVTASPNTITSTTVDFTTLPIVPGQWIKIGNPSVTIGSFATAADNDFVRVLTVVPHLITLDQVPTGWASDTGTGKTIQLFFGDVIRNGTTPRSYTGEVEYSDLATEEWDYYPGLRVGTTDWAATAEDILTYKPTFMGLTPKNVVAAGRPAGVTALAAPTGNVMSAGFSVGELRIAGSPVAGPNYVKAFTLKADDSVARQPGLGTLGGIGIRGGRFKVSGTFTTYYNSNAIRTALLNSVASSWSGIFYDPNIAIPGSYTTGYHFDLPKLKWTGGDPDMTGPDTDRMLALNYSGIKCALGFTLQISRFDYLPT